MEVDGSVVGSCGKGFLVLLGVSVEDTDATCDKLWRKVRDLRIFADSEGKTNLALADVAGEVLVVSQFTLYADTRKGHRPSFTQAARGDEATRLYERFCALADADLGAEHVGRGVFGADMRVSLVNDGPFTVMLEV